jgi:hypothetical protein
VLDVVIHLPMLVVILLGVALALMIVRLASLIMRGL